MSHFVFMQALLDSEGSTFKNNCVKVISVYPYCQRQKCPAESLVFGNRRFVRIFAWIPWVGGIK